jgi:antitoxin (DNA-binding transcriptional repressor) of toxin-antitoxin stability system
MVSKNVLKAKMLEYFRKVEEEGEELIVTHNQIPILKVVPLPKRLSAAEIFADVRGKLKFHADPAVPETGEWGDV